MNIWPVITIVAILSFMCSVIYKCVILGSAGSETSISVEQEKYFSSLVAITPIGNPRSPHPGGGPTAISDSLTSLDSLLLTAGASGELLTPDTPDSIRRNPLSRAVTSLRTSTGSRAKCKTSQLRHSFCQLAFRGCQSLYDTGNLPYS